MKRGGKPHITLVAILYLWLMFLINHRINTINGLKAVPVENGIELDVRYHENDLILHHDPFGHHETPIQKFESLLEHWQHNGPMILNVKTEGIEHACIDLMNKYQIKKWFFLDLSMPMFVIYSHKAANNDITGFSPDNLAVRFSEAEPIEYALSFARRVKWAWVDCFTHMPLNRKNYEQLKNAGFKICLVSPELQKHSPSLIDDFRKQLCGLEIDAVCTKHPDKWEKN